MDPEITPYLRFLDPEIFSTISTIYGSRNCSISAVSGSRNCTISKISGSRYFLVHFYNFWIQKLQYICCFCIQKLHHFCNLWIIIVKLFHSPVNWKLSFKDKNSCCSATYFLNYLTHGRGWGGGNLPHLKSNFSMAFDNSFFKVV